MLWVVDGAMGSAGGASGAGWRRCPGGGGARAANVTLAGRGGVVVDVVICPGVVVVCFLLFAVACVFFLT